MKIAVTPDEDLTRFMANNGIDIRHAKEFTIEHRVGEPVYITVTLLALEKRAEKFVEQNPGRAEALIWEGIVESSLAGAKGGLGALGLVKEARAELETALRLDPRALPPPAVPAAGAVAIVASACLT